MTVSYSAALRNNRLDSVTAAIDAALTEGKIRVYTGPRPASGGVVTTLLAEFTCASTSFPPASGGVMTANAIADEDSAPATGTAVWFRVVDGDDNYVMDGDVGTSGSDLNLNSTSIATGSIVSITSWVHTAGNA